MGKLFICWLFVGGMDFGFGFGSFIIIGNEEFDWQKEGFINLATLILTINFINRKK